jgi:hypothetical protein
LRTMVCRGLRRGLGGRWWRCRCFRGCMYVERNLGEERT